MSRLTILNAQVLMDKDLTLTDLRVYGAICMFANTHSSICFPKQQTIADRLGINVPMVSKSVGVLVEKGYILKGAKVGADGRKKQNYYTIKYDIILPENELMPEHNSGVDELMPQDNHELMPQDKSLYNTNSFNLLTPLTKKNKTKKEIPVVKESLTTEPTVKESLTVEPNCKETLQVESVNIKEHELKTKDEIMNFIRDFNLTSLHHFNRTETDLITEYILKRKEAYKSKVKNTKQALIGLLNSIVETRKQFPLDWIFEMENGCYKRTATSGDATKPFQTIKPEYYKTAQQKSNQLTFNNQYAKSKPDHFSIDKKYAGTKNDDFFDGYINGK